MAVDAEAGSATVKFLHPHIQSSAFTFPDPQDVLDANISDIITQVNPTTTTGNLSIKEMSEATRMLSQRLL